MKTMVIACKTLEDEVNQAVAETENQYNIYWIESGLHNYPDRLRETLQQAIDSAAGCDYIVLLFGLCGNALLGLQSKISTMVIPRVDDCISLFLGGNEKRRAFESSAKAYYLTRGWLRYENNIWQEYEKSIARYGLEKTRSIFKIMLKHYSHLVVIDTGAYDMKAFSEEAEAIAAELGLTLKVVPGELSLLTEAISGCWGDAFAVIEPGEKISLKHMGDCFNYPGFDKPSNDLFR